MSLPAAARHRWGLEAGGDVGYIDVGDAVVLIPAGVDELRRQLLESISDDEWGDAQAGFGDPELSNE